MRHEGKIGVIANAIFYHYVETGEPATVVDISKRVTYSESTIRKAIKEACHFIPDSAYDPVERPVRDASYGTVLRHRRVDAWVPTLRRMREAYISATKW